MNRLVRTVAGGALLLAACNPGAKQQQTFDGTKPVSPASNEATPTVPEPGTGPDARTPLGPTKVAIDPKSPEAAQRLVEQFADRLEARRFGEAYELIADMLPTWKEGEFSGEYSAKREIRTEVGKPTAPEGAAGSVYITVPLSVSGRERNGDRFRESWTLTLRRVNDVPGSSTEQRRWHIERIDVKTH
jgi:hypothetical protein